MNTTEKALVVVFSATGNTRGVAQHLASAIGADFFELKPAQPYTTADLDWTDKKSRSSVEMNDPSCRPAIVEMPANLDSYSIVYVGFPIWWYREPSIIDTFVESNAEALDGKTIVPFATSGGSGMGTSSENLQALAPKAKVVEGRRFRVGVTAEELADWAKQF
ncbi:MAG: flavodoxin [Victivallales bacterium]|nr:flavodoxin [Victivallales bacterium]